MLLLSRVWLEKCSMWMVRCRDLDTIASNSQTLLASHYGADPFLNAWGDRFFLSRLVAELPESQISSLQSCFLGQPTILLHTRLRSAGWDSLVSSTSRLLTGSLEDQFIRVLLYYFMDRSSLVAVYDCRDCIWFRTAKRRKSNNLDPGEQRNPSLWHYHPIWFVQYLVNDWQIVQ